jgi:hypothetical protein
MTLPEVQPQGASPEWAILVACARTGASEAELGEVLRLAQGDPDWEEVLRLAFFHGVTGLLSETVSRVPEAPIPEARREELRDAHRSVARSNLRLTALFQNLLEAFQEKGVPVIPFKGPVLGLRAYGDVSLRTFGDLDFLARKESLEVARRVLRENGLTPLPAHQGLPNGVMLRWGNAESFLTEDGSLVELHWELSKPAWRIRIRAADFWRRAVPRDWMGQSVLGFDADDELLMLCVHGCRHAWSRLIWVCDVAETLKRGEADWPALLRHSAETGTRRMLLLGLSLAESLLQAPLEPEVRQMMARDPVVPVLNEHVTRVFQGGEGLAAQEFLFQIRTRTGIRDRAGFLFGSLLTPTPEDFIQMGPGLPSFAYPLLRPVRLARKYWRLRRQLGKWTRGGH